MKKIITVSRQYASGGREIADRLAKLYNIPFYDRDLIARAAKETGFAEEAFEGVEMRATNSFLYSVAMGMSTYGLPDIGHTSLSLDDRIFLAQSEVIRKVAEEGPCVILGRCADYILKDRSDTVNLFIWASMPERVRRAISRDGIPAEEAEETIRKRDKKRANYYNYHSVEKWGNATNYHLSLQNDFDDVDKAVEVIRTYLSLFK